jgi:hypothetical protein
VFYIHIAPNHGRVLLIGIWRKPVSSDLQFAVQQVA